MSNEHLNYLVSTPSPPQNSFNPLAASTAEESKGGKNTTRVKENQRGVMQPTGNFRHKSRWCRLQSGPAHRDAKISTPGLGKDTVAAFPSEAPQRDDKKKKKAGWWWVLSGDQCCPLHVLGKSQKATHEGDTLMCADYQWGVPLLTSRSARSRTKEMIFLSQFSWYLRK